MSVNLNSTQGPQDPQFHHVQQPVANSDQIPQLGEDTNQVNSSSLAPLQHLKKFGAGALSIGSFVLAVALLPLSAPGAIAGAIIGKLFAGLKKAPELMEAKASLESDLNKSITELKNNFEASKKSIRPNGAEREAAWDRLLKLINDQSNNNKFVVGARNQRDEIFRSSSTSQQGIHAIVEKFMHEPERYLTDTQLENYEVSIKKIRDEREDIKASETKLKNDIEALKSGYRGKVAVLEHGNSAAINAATFEGARIGGFPSSICFSAAALLFSEAAKPIR